MDVRQNPQRKSLSASGGSLCPNSVLSKVVPFQELSFCLNSFLIDIYSGHVLAHYYLPSGGSCEEVGTIDPGFGFGAEFKPFVRGQASRPAGQEHRPGEVYRVP
jgi:hypothetical protein